MIVYHCNIAIDSVRYEIMSFNIIEAVMLITNKWLSFDTPCMVGAFI